MIDSRLSQGGEVTRRRRECEQCARRYTSYERVEFAVPTIVKTGGRREPFDRLKVMAGLKRASIKRPVSIDALEKIVDAVERRLLDTGEKEVPSSEVGEQVLKELLELDAVAYIRFASVYRKFENLDGFVAELSRLTRQDALPLPRIQDTCPTPDKNGPNRAKTPGTEQTGQVVGVPTSPVPTPSAVTSPVEA